MTQEGVTSSGHRHAEQALLGWVATLLGSVLGALHFCEGNWLIDGLTD